MAPTSVVTLLRDRGEKGPGGGGGGRPSQYVAFTTKIVPHGPQTLATGRGKNQGRKRKGTSMSHVPSCGDNCPPETPCGSTPRS